MDHARIDALVLRREFLGKLAVDIIRVPIPRLGEDQTLGDRQAKRLDVADEHEQSGKLLPTLDDAELGRLLDRIDGIAAGVRQPDDFGLRGLRSRKEEKSVPGTGWRTSPRTLPPLF